MYLIFQREQLEKEIEEDRRAEEAIRNRENRDKEVYSGERDEDGFTSFIVDNGEQA